jgi:chromatin structure-remodeling complex subunit RSC9
MPYTNIRTPFQPEPVVGHRKISLLKLYNKVLELGGYDAVTEEKGLLHSCGVSNVRTMEENIRYLQFTCFLYKWRISTQNTLLQIPFVRCHLQCKLTYRAFEIEKHWGKKPPPPDKLEFLSAKGPGIMSRPENWRHPDVTKALAEAPAGTPQAAVIGGRSLRQSITPRNFYAEENYLQRKRSPERTSTPPIYSSAQPFQNMQMNQYNPMQMPQQQRQSVVGTAGHQLGAGFVGADLPQRIAMALRSGLHEEIDWALHELVRMSYEIGDDIRLEGVLGLADALLDKISTIFKHIPSSMTDKKRKTHYHFQAKEYDKILEAMLILRNSALQEDNAIFLALRAPRTKSIIERILALPYVDYPELMELRYYALDVAEAIIPYIAISGEDDVLYVSMKHLLLSPERSSLILGLKALARLAVNDENNSLLQDIPVESVTRVRQLLFLEDDEELVNAALDFLYQYTTYKSNVQTLVAKSGNMMKFVNSLLRLMGYGAKDQRITMYVLRRMIPLEKLNAEPPALNPEILSALLKLNEPERCIQWFLSL